jgi:hypothetical protein
MRDKNDVTIDIEFSDWLVAQDRSSRPRMDDFWRSVVMDKTIEKLWIQRIYVSHNSTFSYIF